MYIPVCVCVCVPWNWAMFVWAYAPRERLVQSIVHCFQEKPVNKK